MALEVITAPASDPVTTAEAKTFCRISTSDDDTLIGELITKAREYMEDFLERTLIDTTYDLHMDGFFDPQYVDKRVIKVPRPPLSSVTSISYIDTAGNSQTLASTEYRVDSKTHPGRITEEWGKVYPATRGVTGDVTIRYVGGYGSAGSDVPEMIKVAIKQLVGTTYDLTREGHSMDHAVRQMPYAGELLAWPRRMVGF